MAKPEQNFHYQDPETGEAKWYGPDYPENGEPPEGVVRNQAVFKAPPPEDLTPREVLEGAADPTRALELPKDVVRGADETGDQARSDARPSEAPMSRASRHRG